MSYSRLNPRWHRMMQAQGDRLAELEKEKARAYQKADPTLTWGQALRLATRQPIKRQAG